jgi:Undecaprenyl-phosphate glucose phosphotransferase
MKIWIEAQQFESIGRNQSSVAFEGVGRLIMASDALLILLTGVLVGYGYHGLFLHEPTEVVRYVTIGAMFVALMLPIGEIRGHYQSSVVFNLSDQLKGLAVTWVGISMFLVFVAFGLKIGTTVSRGAVWSFGTAGFAIITANRLAWAYAARRAHAQGVLRTRKIALLSIGDAVHKSLRYDLVHHGLEIAARSHVSARPGTDEFLALIREFAAGLRGSDVKEVYLLVRTDRLDGLPMVLEQLRVVPMPIHLIPEPAIASLVERSWKAIGSTVAIEVQREPIGLLERGLKRALDICVSATALCILSPLLLAVSIAIKLDSPGRILFVQSRCGFNGKPFRILKFRSMRVVEDGEVVKQATRHDDRVTRVGRFIRRTSLDELPQLFNVLNGDMSLVGPRPHAVAHDTYYDDHINDYAMRQNVKPGLTGWAQVNGHRGLTPTIESMARRVEYDLWYIDNRSFWLDVKILFLTVKELFGSRHAF